MSFELAAVDPPDAGDLVRQVDFPSMQEGPLYRIMFPDSSTLAVDQREEIVQWYISGLEETLLRGKEKFQQIRMQDGTPIGFCGWMLDRAEQSEAQPVRPRRHNLLPETLDLQAWGQVSADLRAERERCLAGLQNVCRLTFMGVHPDHQRQGAGSLLMQWFCEQVDRSQRFAFVMASPAGIRLYEKFGFKTVGVVSSQKGHFTSMLRRPRGVFTT
ncbi:acyl-CoA N-acyltransferase [Xylaria intraflava]|nr:acyl-CoA N-acyltransferase [Xylaria intraflava]